MTIEISVTCDGCGKSLDIIDLNVVDTLEEADWIDAKDPPDTHYCSDCAEARGIDR